MPEHSVRSRMRQMLPVRYAHRSINSVRLLMARVPDAEVSQLDRSIRAVLEAQAKRWGGPLLNHLIYARRPSIFKGARMMWSGLDASGLIDGRLTALVNRRVAFLNGCEF